MFTQSVKIPIYHLQVRDAGERPAGLRALLRARAHVRHVRAGHHGRAGPRVRARRQLPPHRRLLPLRGLRPRPRRQEGVPRRARAAGVRGALPGQEYIRQRNFANVVTLFGDGS